MLFTVHGVLTKVISSYKGGQNVIKDKVGPKMDGDKEKNLHVVN